MAERIPQSTTLRVPFQAILAADHTTPATGKVIVVTISKNGAPYANPSAGAVSATEVGSGSYYIDLSATDTNTPGPLTIKGVAGTIDTVFVPYDVVTVAQLSPPVVGAATPAGTNFLLPVDIGNRALQHCGQRQMDTVLGFTEVSKNAKEVGSCYAKLRRAELRRNVWRFAIRKAILRAVDTPTMLLAPSLWSSGSTYFVGSVVADENGYWWESRIPDNLGNAPQTTPLAWEPYFGPRSVARYDSATSYNASELVYTTGGQGTARVYKSLQNANTDNPATATAWSATATYRKNDVITYLGTPYMSRIDFNLNQTPTASPADWSSVTVYAIGNQVTGSDGVIYTSLQNGNTNHDPTASPTWWTNTGLLSPWDASFVGGAGALTWRQIGGAEFAAGVSLSELNLIYPVGTGPSTQVTTRNVFLLPAGFLRRAPTDPRAGSTSYLGAPSGLPYDDWTLENDLLVSAESGPLMLRFVCDMTDVSRMDDMFCEGLGARIALEVVEALTQSAAKLSTIAKVYTQVMTDARLVNAIETGTEEPPEDDWITCRG